MSKLDDFKKWVAGKSSFSIIWAITIALLAFLFNRFYPNINLSDVATVIAILAGIIAATIDYTIKGLIKH